MKESTIVLSIFSNQSVLLNIVSVKGIIIHFIVIIKILVHNNKNFSDDLNVPEKLLVLLV